MQYHSEPWQENEIEAAGDLRRAIIEVILQQAEELACVNQELRHSNAELDSFAYAASHDLKEPLRGIRHYAQFLAEDFADQLGEEGNAHIAALQRLTRRMETLLDFLLDFARVGRGEFPLSEANVDEVVAHALEMVSGRLTETGADIQVHGPLGYVRCNVERLAEVFSNLLTNAVKYNDKPHKRIDVGVRHQPALPGEPSGERIFYVRDNGIGIAAEDIPNIFQIFRRLHGRDAYGGGTGVGLTLVKRIIERHGGRIWVESTPGEGTTMFFTISETGAGEPAED